MAKFIKGQSGNPGGPPKELAEVQAIARQHSPAAISTLAQIMEDKKAPPAARIAAAQAILDRSYGRPPQAVKLSGDEEGSPIQLKHAATEELLEELARVRKRMEETEPERDED